jgi:hypothetical protein
LKAATPKVVAPKAATTKVVTLVVLSTVGGATTSKVATAEQKGPRSDEGWGAKDKVRNEKACQSRAFIGEDY